MNQIKNSEQNKNNINIFDEVFDGLIKASGISLSDLEEFFLLNKKGVRLVANSLSLFRIIFGYVVIRYYEKAYEEKDRSGMVFCLLLFIVIFASDSVDGYICRKANIADNKAGKVIDSVGDVVLRLLVAKFLILTKRDWIYFLRLFSEFGVAYYAVPDIYANKYSSTSLGKAKVVSDFMSVMSCMIADIVSYDNKRNNLWKSANRNFRLLSVFLACLDACMRGRNKSINR